MALPARPFLFPSSPHQPQRPSPPTSVAAALSGHSSDHKLVVSGGRPLSGHVHISGSKNATLAVLAGSLCCSGASALHRVPDIADTRTMVRLLRSLGVLVESAGHGDMVVSADRIRSVEPCSESVAGIRAGFLVLAPLLARFGEAVVGLPGGCDIGARPVDLHLRGLRQLGALVEMRDGKVYACAANGRSLVGGRFCLDYPSVGATQTLMLAASMAVGESILSNVSREPEVTDLAEYLVASGARIKGIGTRRLVITGRKRMNGAEFTLIPDRIEAGTFMVAAAITRSSISLSPIIPCHLTSVTNQLLAIGCKVTRKRPHMLEVSASPIVCDELHGASFKTAPYPGFPTDLQPQLIALLATCRGSSLVQETVFENRMNHVNELKKLGAQVVVSGNSCIVSGESKLHGSSVVAGDLRGGVSLALAGLAAEGTTEITGASHIDRGYENLEAKLVSLGAHVGTIGPTQEHSLCQWT